MRVVVLGASDRPDRYSNKAVRMLRQHGHEVVPVHPRLTEVEGLPVVPSLDQVAGPVDTVTVYVGPDHSAPLTAAFLALAPRRVVFNPGSENPALAAELRGAGIAVEEACTLVLLATGAF